MTNQIIVMGVSGSGKTTLAATIAENLHFHYLEGDHLHSPASVQKMAAGIALEDADRWPWLDRIGEAVKAGASAERGIVASCSALRRAYRDRLRQNSGQWRADLLARGETW